MHITTNMEEWLSHNIYVKGPLFSHPWVCRGWLLEPSFLRPSRGNRNAVVFIVSFIFNSGLFSERRLSLHVDNINHGCGKSFLIARGNSKRFNLPQPPRAPLQTCLLKLTARFPHLSTPIGTATHYQLSEKHLTSASTRTTLKMNLGRVRDPFELVKKERGVQRKVNKEREGEATSYGGSVWDKIVWFWLNPQKFLIPLFHICIYYNMNK